jgi:hypothetical protein
LLCTQSVNDVGAFIMPSTMRGHCTITIWIERSL